MTTFFRLLKTEIEAKGERMLEQVQCFNAGESVPDTFTVKPNEFAITQESPFAYWLSKEVRLKLQDHPTLEPAAAEVRVGLQTGDDIQFVRAIWETNPADAYFCYYPSGSSNVCQFDDPVVRAFFERRGRGKMKWAFLVKAGLSQPWYSPLFLVVNWENDGQYVKEFVRSRGYSPSKWVQNERYYFRPGFSWTLRAVRLMPYVVPSNAISTVSRYMAFPLSTLEFATVAFAASNLASGFARIYGEKFEWPKFLVETIKKLPWAEKFAEAKDEFDDLVSQEVGKRRRAYALHEPFQEFLVPWRACSWSSSDLNVLEFDTESLLGREREKRVAQLFGLNDLELAELESDLLEAIEVRKRGRASIENDAGETEDQEDSSQSELVIRPSPESEVEELLQYSVGCAFGRWDVRMALNPSLPPKATEPFDPLPVCSPGMLVSPDGLPATEDNIVSEEWLASRPNVITLPDAQSLTSKGLPITTNEYPLTIEWDGIIPDDENHASDIVRRVREVIHLLWGDRADAIEQEACQILGIPNLREYFRQPKHFFDFHIKRYSKSRRKAPIYWLLQSKNRRYGIWLYYHRLTPDTLYRAGREYVDPKLNLETQRLRDLQARLPGLKGAALKTHEREIAAQADLVAEIAVFQKTLDRIAFMNLHFDLNDGVLLNIAPLHEVVTWKEAGKTWEELKKGEYAWSSMSQQLRALGLVKG